MRIMQMCTRFVPGGIQRHAIDLATWLRTRGHEVTLCGTPGAWAGPAEPEFLPVDVHNVAAEGGPLPRRLLYLARAVLALRRELVARKIELVHAHESAPGLVAGLAALGTGIPILISYHGSAPGRVREFAQIARRFARLIITPSHHSADDLAVIGGVPRERLRVIGLGVNPAAPLVPEEILGTRQDLLGDGAVVVLTVARLAHQKGIDVLVETAGRVCAANPSIRFVVVGDGPQRDEARQWARLAGIEARLRFVGHSDRPELFMAAADMFLLTSRWESLPITIVEAFRQGLPVIATDCGGVGELVDGSVGCLVKVGDVAALEEAVLTLAQDRAMRTRLSAAALARSGEDRFDPIHVNETFEELYLTTIAGHERG